MCVPVHLWYISFLKKYFANGLLLVHPASALMSSRGHFEFKIIHQHIDFVPPPSMLPGTPPVHQLPQETNFTPKTNQNTSIQSRGPHRLPLCVPVHLRYIPSPRKPFIGPLGKSGLAHPRVHPKPPGTPLPVHGYMSGKYARSFRTEPYIYHKLIKVDGIL